jgi:TetR/AcrR family transcriptional regulator, regulator of biofilm formation and stress response
MTAIRRFDPTRRDRLVDAALEVIADHGLAGLTARRIATAAAVPLGSVSYHFDGLAGLVREAFTRHAEAMAVVFRAHFSPVTDRAAMLEAAVAFVHGEAGASRRDWVVAYELYLAALREPALREVTQAWMQGSRDVLQGVLDPDTARALDGVMEGLTMHAILSTATPSPAQTRAVLARVLGIDP